VIEFEEGLNVLVLDGPAQRSLHKSGEEPLRIRVRIIRSDLYLE